LKRPRELFIALCKQFPDSMVFAEQELKTSKPANEVEAAIVKSLQASPNGFQILKNDLAMPKTYLVTAEFTFSLGILGGTQRDCLLVVGQTKDDETQICSRWWNIRFNTKLVNFHDVKHLIPVQQSRLPSNEFSNRFKREFA